MRTWTKTRCHTKTEWGLSKELAHTMHWGSMLCSRDLLHISRSLAVRTWKNCHSSHCVLCWDADEFKTQKKARQGENKKHMFLVCLQRIPLPCIIYWLVKKMLQMHCEVIPPHHKKPVCSVYSYQSDISFPVEHILLFFPPMTAVNSHSLAFKSKTDFKRWNQC